MLLAVFLILRFSCALVPSLSTTYLYFYGRKDYLLLDYLAQSTSPIEIDELDVPHALKVNFQFHDLDRYQSPNSVWVHLFELSEYRLVKEPSAKHWIITDTGRTELQSYLLKKNKPMIGEETLLRYFYRQDRPLDLEELFEKYGTHDRILTPINFLVDNDWLENAGNATQWVITKDGKREQERRDKANNVFPSTSIHVAGQGNIVNTGSIEGNLQNNITHLQETGFEQISFAIAALADAIKDSEELQQEQKNEYLENLKVLSEEALKPSSKRLPRSTIKNIIQHGLGTLNTLSSVSTIGGINLKDIAAFFQG